MTGICVSVCQKNAFYIWHVTNHKSQICDCYTQTQMRCGNAPVVYDNSDLEGDVNIKDKTMDLRDFNR